jgi:hypothetical protein
MWVLVRLFVLGVRTVADGSTVVRRRRSGAYMHRYAGGTTAVLILSIALRVISSGQMLFATGET